MVAPITWRSVNAPDFSGSSNMMEQSRRSFAQALSSAGGLVDDYQNIQAKNQQNAVDKNTEAFLNTLNSRYRDPTALAEAQVSGELDALRQQFGQYGLDETRTNAEAVNSLISNQRTRVQEDQQFADFQTQLNNRAARNAHDVAIAEGRLEDAAKIREGAEFLNEGAMAQDAARARDAQIDRNWALEQRVNARQDRAETQKQKDILKKGRDLAAQKFMEVQSQNLNPTQARNELIQELMGIDGITPDMVTGIATNMDNADFLTGQLSKRDQAGLDTELAKLDQSVQKNPFTQWRNADESPAAAAVRVLESAQSKIEDGWDQEEIHDFALTAMTDGLDLGMGTKQQLPPEAVAYVINHPDVGAWWNGNPESHVRRLITDNPYWKEKLLEDTQYQIDRKTYQTEYLKKTLGGSSPKRSDDSRRDNDVGGYFLKKLQSRE